MTDLVVRPLEAGEETLFTSLPDRGLVGRKLLGNDFAEMAAKGEYRPEWVWVALRDDVVVARAAWWGDAEGRRADRARLVRLHRLRRGRRAAEARRRCARSTR